MSYFLRQLNSIKNNPIEKWVKDINRCMKGNRYIKRCSTSVVFATAKSLQLCPTLCDPIDGSPPGSAVPGILRQEHWGGLPFLLQCRKMKSESEVSQLCPTLHDPMDCSPQGSSVHGIFQARVLEWGAIAFSQ